MVAARIHERARELEVDEHGGKLRGSETGICEQFLEMLLTVVEAVEDKGLGDVELHLLLLLFPLGTDAVVREYVLGRKGERVRHGAQQLVGAAAFGRIYVAGNHKEVSALFHGGIGGDERTALFGGFGEEDSPRKPAYYTVAFREMIGKRRRPGRILRHEQTARAQHSVVKRAVPNPETTVIPAFAKALANSSASFAP